MIILSLQSSSLISLGQLCDDNCNVVVTKDHLHAIKNGRIILQGKRNLHDGIWDIPLQKHPHQKAAYVAHSPLKQHTMHVIIRKKQSAKGLVEYLHAACFSPVKATWIKAIQNNTFVTWPGLTAELVAKHLPPSTATVQGHIHQERQHLQSTQVQKKVSPSAGTSWIMDITPGSSWNTDRTDSTNQKG